MSTQEEISPIANQPSVPSPSDEKELASSSSSNNNHVLEKEDGEPQRKKKFGELGGVAREYLLLIWICKVWGSSHSQRLRERGSSGYEV